MQPTVPYITAWEWRSGENLGELALFFYHVGPGGKTHIVSFAAKHQAPLPAEPPYWTI